eukprot:1781656-Rhodomonas_salina.1
MLAMRCGVLSARTPQVEDENAMSVDTERRKREIQAALKRAEKGLRYAPVGQDRSVPGLCLVCVGVCVCVRVGQETRGRGRVTVRAGQVATELLVLRRGDGQSVGRGGQAGGAQDWRRRRAGLRVSNGYAWHWPENGCRTALT